MRKLITEEIERLSSQKGVRRTSVENFLSTMGTDYLISMHNFELDAELYHWDTSTIKAILTGIMLACERNYE